MGGGGEASPNWWPRASRNTGKHVELRGASMLEFADDKIRRCSDYVWDAATFLRQIGLMPAG
jgi:ketosteroid isomerase-like protein